MKMKVVGDYGFPTEDEETALIEEVSEMFMAIRGNLKPMVLISEEFAKLSFAINPGVFGDKLENGERCLPERIERSGQERGKERTKRTGWFPAGLPKTAMHRWNLKAAPERSELPCL